MKSQILMVPQSQYIGGQAWIICQLNLSTTFSLSLVFSTPKWERKQQYPIEMKVSSSGRIAKLMKITCTLNSRYNSSIKVLWNLIIWRLDGAFLNSMGSNWIPKLNLKHSLKFKVLAVWKLPQYSKLFDDTF